MTGSVTVAAHDGCKIQSIDMPSIFSVDGAFVVTTSGTGAINVVGINANAANDAKQQLLPMHIAGGFRVVVADRRGEIGDVEVHNVAALGTDANKGAALGVTNVKGHVGNVRVVGAAKTGLSLLGETGIALLQAGGPDSAALPTGGIAYSGMVMIENVLTVDGSVSVSTDSKSDGFLAGLSLLPSPSNSYSFDVGGDITVALNGSHCRDDGIRLSLPEEHQPRYQYGPRILFTNVSAITGTINVDSNGGSCLSDLELTACPAVKDAAIHGSVRILSASTSKSPGGINVFRAEAFNTIGGDVIIRAKGAAQTIASIIRAHIDAKEINGSVLVSTDTRGVIHNVELRDNSKISSGRLHRIQGNLAVDGTISTGVSIFGTPEFEVVGNVSITASGYRQGKFKPRGRVIIPLLSAVGGNLDVGHAQIVPEISINAADVEDRPQLHVKGSVRIGSAPTEYGIGVPTEGELWASDAEAFVGPTTVDGLVIVEGNLEIASNVAGSAADPQSDGSVFVAGHPDTGGFGLKGALKMVAVKGSPGRTVSISGMKQLPKLIANERRVYQVNSASFGTFLLNGIEVDSTQIPPEAKMTRDALCFAKCNGFGFVGGSRGGGCSGRTCTCFGERYGQYCSENATRCTDTQFEFAPVTSTDDRICVEARSCTAGEMMTAPLQATSDRICKPCPNGQFQQEDGHAYSECKAWSLDCDEESYELVSPSNFTDRKCAAYAVCATNEIESSLPTATSDRACTPCQEGEFASAVSNTCLAINSCTPGFVEVSPPTAAKDRVCMGCPRGKFANKEGSSCMAWAPNCAAGTYESETPSKSNDRQCTQCTYGTFQDDNSETSAYFSCQQWARPCSEGFYEVASPTRFADRSCRELPTCKTGFLQKRLGGSASSPSSSSNADIVSYVCLQWSLCTPGTYAASEPSLSSNRVCSTCPPRSYQDRVAHFEPKCKTWTFEDETRCPAGTYESVSASPTSDRLCRECDLLLANGVAAVSSVPAVCLAFLNDGSQSVPSRTADSSITNEQLAEKNASIGLIAGCILGALILVVSLAFGVKKMQSTAPKPGDKDFKVMMKETNFKINPNNYPEDSATPSKAREQRANLGDDDACYSQLHTPMVPPRLGLGNTSTMPMGTRGVNNLSLSMNLSNMPAGGTSTMDLYAYVTSPINSLTSTPAANEPTNAMPQYETVGDLETSIYLEPTTVQTLSTGFVDEEGMYDESTMPVGQIVSPMLSPPTATETATATPAGMTPRPTLESPVSYSSPPARLVLPKNNTSLSTPGSGLWPAPGTGVVRLPTLRRPVMSICVDATHTSSTTTPPAASLESGGKARHPMFDVRRSTKVALIQGKPVFRSDLLAKKDCTPLRAGFTVTGLGGIDASTESAIKASPSSASILAYRQEGLRSISKSPTVRRESFETLQSARFSCGEGGGMCGTNTINGQLAEDDVSLASSPRASPEYRPKSTTSLV